MVTRSQRARRFRDGIDSAGITAYERGEDSLIPVDTQFALAQAFGRTPIPPAGNAAAMIPAFLAASAAGALNYERYSFYIPGSVTTNGIIPRAHFDEQYARGVRLVRNFAEVFDPNNNFEFMRSVSSIATSAALAPDEVSIGNHPIWNPVVGDPVVLRWDGPATQTIGGITITRGQVYNVSSVGGSGPDRFVRIRGTGTRSADQTVTLTNGGAMLCVWRNLNTRGTNWYASIQNALDAGMYVIVTPFGKNLWDFATTQGGNPYGAANRNNYGWAGLYLLCQSWCAHIQQNINDPQRRLALEWQNESVALGANDAAREATDRPIREEFLALMRAVTPTRVIVAGGANFSSVGSLAQIVPTLDTGVLYKAHLYTDSMNPASAWANAVAWSTATGRPFFVAEFDRFTTDNANSVTRRNLLITHRDWLRANRGIGPTYWAVTYGTGAAARPLGTWASNTFTWFSNMLPVVDERPINETLPTITGTAQVGQTLTASTGTWAGRAPITYTFQWLRAGVAVPGATAATYTLTVADQGAAMEVRVQGQNSLGTGIATSQPTSPVQPVQGGGESTAIDWQNESTFFALASTVAGMVLNDPLHIHDANTAASVTTANGAVSSFASLSPATRSLIQNTAANQPSHSTSTGTISFASDSQTDENGDFLATGTGSGTLAQLLGNAPNSGQRGVVYMTFRFLTVPTWRTYLFSGGTQHNTFADERNGVAVCVLSSGVIRSWRASGTAVTVAATTGTVVANVWHAIAFVFNDDRTTPNTSDNLPRLRVKSAAGGNFTTMESVDGNTARTWSTSANNPRARIGRALYDPTGGMGNWELREVIVDLAPPTSDGVLEANLNYLLSRV
jgi:hypothetical protein